MKNTGATTPSGHDGRGATVADAADIAHAADGADSRLEGLRDWLVRELQFEPARLAPASVDASFRRYFRVWRGNETFIAMDAPPDKLSIGPYIAVAAMLGKMGVTVPRILASDEASGFLLATDLGTRLYLEDLAAGRNVEALYADAMRALCAIQSRGTQPARTLPEYDRAFFLREMSLMPEWFCERHLRIELGSAERAMLERCFDALAGAALEQPRVFVHRDFHSRNLMVLDQGNPGVLDFQDAVHGPITYDAVSLLKDCYVAWPRARVREWLGHYRAMSAASGVDVGESEEQYLRWFDLLGAQRHLKVLGIFARLCHRDGKPGYLRDLPRVMNYIIDISAQYAELEELGEFLETRAAPILAPRTAETFA